MSKDYIDINNYIDTDDHEDFDDDDGYDEDDDGDSDDDDDGDEPSSGHRERSWWENLQFIRQEPNKARRQAMLANHIRKHGQVSDSTRRWLDVN